ncbi:hypothetical protein F7U66_00865 [Vibrio parahaemolyticus]|nr:hypothetical protein [Vibrio parahaemolyticus]
MEMFGKLDLKNVAVALDQVAGAFSGPESGTYVEMKIDDEGGQMALQLRAVGNQMDILSDRVLVESNAKGKFVFHWEDFESTLKWPKSNKVGDLDWKITPHETVEDQHVFSVTRGRARLETVTCGEPMPAAEELSPKAKMIVDSSNFALGLRRAGSMAGREDVRVYLNGVYLEAKAKGDDGKPVVTAVGTDGHRLACVKMNPLKFEGKPCSVIVPNSGVSQIEMFMNRFASGHMALGFCSSHIVMKGENGYRLRCKLLDGNYPDFRRVIPDLGEAKVVTVSKDDLSFGLGIAAKTAGKGRKPLVELDFQTDTIGMKGFWRVGDSATIKKSEYAADAKGFSGTPFVGYLSIAYLQDAFSLLSKPQVDLHVYNATTAVVVVEDDALYVVMPTRP